jgi:hypothetical protein
MGFRMARPNRAREWGAATAYALAIVVQVLGARGLLPGGSAGSGMAQRIFGAAVLIVGLIVAGGPARARRSALAVATAARTVDTVRVGPAYAGLALVLLGHLLRGPSAAGALATAVAAPLLAWPALTSQRGDRPERP